MNTGPRRKRAKRHEMRLRGMLCAALQITNRRFFHEQWWNSALDLPMEHYFQNDSRRMALELRVTEKTLEAALSKEGSAESMLLFEQLMKYLHDNNLSMDNLLAMYGKQRE